MIRSILVHVDALPASSARLLATLELGRRFDAAVTAAFAVAEPSASAPYAYSAQAVASGPGSDFAAVRRERVQRDLRRHLAGDAPPTTWVEVAGPELPRRFIDEAAYADLLVLGAMGSAALGGPGPGFVEEVLLGSGKPGLVMPAGARPAAIGRRVMVAWNGSPQAARALAAALPFLQRADTVDVVAWAPARVAAPSGIDVGTFLRRHGVEATVERRAPGRAIAAELAAAAADRGADLIVMGCYGHGRWRERVLGGATRAVLASPTLPTLLAH
jgi:nucleotide-binding universal stress UspA family protein